MRPRSSRLSDYEHNQVNDNADDVDQRDSLGTLYQINEYFDWANSERTLSIFVGPDLLFNASVVDFVLIEPRIIALAIPRVFIFTTDVPAVASSGLESDRYHPSLLLHQFCLGCIECGQVLL